MACMYAFCYLLLLTSKKKLFGYRTFFELMKPLLHGVWLETLSFRGWVGVVNKGMHPKKILRRKIVPIFP